jgi:hypothetical protein
MWGRSQRYGNESWTRLAGGRHLKIFRYSARFRHAASANGTVLVLTKRKDGRRRLLLMNVICKISKFVLDLPEMIVNALIIALSVALKPMQILEQTVDVICDNDAWSLRRRPF